MKRAIETQFTWIFILIAGAVILTFFVTIGYRQQHASEQKFSIALEQSLDSIISETLQSPGTSLPVPTPSAGVAFRCTRTCDCKLFVGSQGTDFAEKIYFAPSRIEESDMILWTQPFSVPFRAANLLYIIDPLTTYYIVTSSSSAESIQLRDSIAQILPALSNVQFIDDDLIGTIQNTGKTRFIFLRSGKTALHPSFSDNIMHAVEIRGNDVQFLIKDEDLLTFAYVASSISIPSDNIPLILGAMFSANRDMFTCGLTHAYLKQQLVADVLTQRAYLLDGTSNLDGSAECYYTEYSATRHLEELSSIAHNLSISAENPVAITHMDRVIANIETKNTEKIINGCPALY